MTSCCAPLCSAVQKALLEKCEAVDVAVHAMRTLLTQVQKVVFSNEDEPVMLSHHATYQLFSKPEEVQQEEGESKEGEVDSNEDDVLLVMVEPTKAEIEEDRRLRQQILLGLFQLACAMVRDSANSIDTIWNQHACTCMPFNVHTYVHLNFRAPASS